VKEPKYSIKKYAPFIVTLLVLVGIGILLSFMRPSEIVETIGVRNSYWVIFVVAVLGGVSSFTSTSFYATAVTFVAGGSHPLLIGIISGLGMSVGDSIFYFLGSRGRKAFLEQYKEKINIATKWLEGKARWVVSLLIFIYMGFTPLPGDILMVSLAVLDYSYKKIIPFVIIGNITLITILGYLSYYGVRLSGIA